MALSVPGPVELPLSQYDLSTYYGRYRHMLEITDPTMCLCTSRDFEEAKVLVAKYKNGEIKQMTPELWHAKRVLDSALHPDTGEVVVLPFRMSSNVLLNLVVTAGMLTPGLGTAGTIFWQMANQLLNVAVNTSNANKLHPLTWTQIATNYAIAVAALCGVAVGLNKSVPRMSFLLPRAKLVAARLVPFAAVVLATMVNIGVMRGGELSRGIAVYNADTGEPLGTSKKAAMYAVGETAALRAINATPIMALPPLLLMRLQQGVLKGRGGFAVGAANLALVAATSFAVLPMALAVFPQTEIVLADRLEPELRKEGVQRILFNRGM